MLNWNLLKHPINWVIVTLMVLLAAIPVHFLASFYNPTSKPKQGS